jgi:hypothetical protein
VDFLGKIEKWDGTFVRAMGDNIQFRSRTRPVIGLSPSSDSRLESFLRQQGYIVEITQAAGACSIFLDRPHFPRENERGLLAEIEESNAALVRFSRWPNGARSALCVTGDIDALTIWDYALRALGK